MEQRGTVSISGRRKDYDLANTRAFTAPAGIIVHLDGLDKNEFVLLTLTKAAAERLADQLRKAAAEV